MGDMSEQLEVRDEPGASRYEARIGDALAGYAAYRLGAGTITFTHTVTDPAFGGQGVASALARTALNAARSAGLEVVAECAFIAGWVAKHPDYQDLLA